MSAWVFCESWRATSTLCDVQSGIATEAVGTTLIALQSIMRASSCVWFGVCAMRMCLACVRAPPPRTSRSGETKPPLPPNEDWIRNEEPAENAGLWRTSVSHVFQAFRDKSAIRDESAGT